MGVLIIGGGQAGFQTAASLRAEGYQEKITIVGHEPGLPYQRPPLSKGILLGKQEARHAQLRPASFYETQNIELIAGRKAVAIDRASRHVALDSGERIQYTRLVLATGARNRILESPGVLYLRTLPEAGEIKQRLAEASSVAVIGGGFIGLEVAAAARTLGKQVTVTETQDRLMARVVAPVVSEYFRQQHVARGTEILFHSTASARPGADLVIVGIGIVPNLELARDAGLPVANGIVVDEYLRTADENIFAIGDCAEFPSVFARARVRLESVQNAVDQAASVARTITGHEAPYTAAPWFWTDQYDIHLQMAGLSAGSDQVVLRGVPESGKFSVFYYRQGRLLAVNSINRPADHLAARKLIASGSAITPGQAADLSFNLTP